MNIRDLNIDAYRFFIIGVRAHICDKDLRQKNVAKDIGLTPGNFSSYLNFRTNMPGATVSKITDYFEKTIQNFIEIGQIANGKKSKANMIIDIITKSEVINDEIVSALSHEGSLFVITKNKVFKWKERENIFEPLPFMNSIYKR